MSSACSSFSALSSWALNAATKRAVVSLDSVIASPPKEYCEAEGQEGYGHPRGPGAQARRDQSTPQKATTAVVGNRTAARAIALDMWPCRGKQLELGVKRAARHFRQFQLKGVTGWGAVRCSHHTPQLAGVRSTQC